MRETSNCWVTVHAEANGNVLYGREHLEEHKRYQKFTSIDVQLNSGYQPLLLDLQIQEHLEAQPILRGICFDKEGGRKQCPQNRYD